MLDFLTIVIQEVNKMNDIKGIRKINLLNSEDIHKNSDKWSFSFSQNEIDDISKCKINPDNMNNLQQLQSDNLLLFKKLSKIIQNLEVGTGFSVIRNGNLNHENTTP